jgi:hypothetical protein
LQPALAEGAVSSFLLLAELVLLLLQKSVVLAQIVVLIDHLKLQLEPNFHFGRADTP